MPPALQELEVDRRSSAPSVPPRLCLRRLPCPARLLNALACCTAPRPTSRVMTLKAGPGSVTVKTSGSSSYELPVSYTLHAPGKGDISARRGHRLMLISQTRMRQSLCCFTPSQRRKSALSWVARGQLLRCLHLASRASAIADLALTRLTLADTGSLSSTTPTSAIAMPA